MKFVSKDNVFKAAAIVPKWLARRAVERNRLRRAVYNGLSVAGVGAPGSCAIFFVRGIPKEKNITRVFAKEIALLIKKIHHV
jgi:RNase P protein component